MVYFFFILGVEGRGRRLERCLSSSTHSAGVSINRVAIMTLTKQQNMAVTT